MENDEAWILQLIHMYTAIHVYSIVAIISMFQSCNIILTYKFYRF